MLVKWNGGEGFRIPVYCRNLLQDPQTLIFSAVVPATEEKYEFRYASPAAKSEAAVIYEAHIGMSQENPGIGSFDEFRENVLPRIAAGGYNTLQLMAIMEHPYYGSFGYHVANFFAVSSRFGTEKDFKHLVDEAHHLGLRVIIDLVHSHAVRNEAEGPAAVDGSRALYFHQDSRGIHHQWDSLCFDYSREETITFLLSNCRYYLEEFNIDGFRFDGVTSMLYLHHGIGYNFCSYDDYFNDSVDEDAIAYLAVANRMIHEFKPSAITIAEDVSGMPGLAAKEFIGFDYRMAMGVSDMWFKLFDISDESWNMFYLYNELTNRRCDEKAVSYVECHDQAIVGGQTAIFRLAGEHMYYAMRCDSNNHDVDRAVALHKMIRLATAAAAGHGYLNFMGNEFGHPEWIDFPREGNNWSYHYARRQWHLADDAELRYHFLSDFDREMLHLINDSAEFYNAPVQTVKIDDQNKIIIFERNKMWFVFNFHPTNSICDYRFEAVAGEYETLLDSDDAQFGGFCRRTAGQHYFTMPEKNGAILSLYLPCRSALVLKLR
jgi:1,4-alpha-glucan branching enzyme